MAPWRSFQTDGQTDSLKESSEGSRDGARLSKNQQTPLTDGLETPGSRRPLLSSEAPEGNPLNGRLRVRELADTSRPQQKSCKYIGFSCLTLHPSPSVSTSQPQP
ncbi:unnamed protein product [Gadus morhua 'NCC']